MSYAVPDFSRKQITRAGQVLIAANVDSKEYAEALKLINFWRACHAYPINTFQATLRLRLKKISTTVIVARRLKRIPSIERKLRSNQGMQLARMQDIGGLRAIVTNMRQVRALHARYSDGTLTHKLIGIDDYIDHPKQSGYRSLHLIYRYKNPLVPKYDGLCLELQIRTRMQHIWATAVETVGSFLNQALKSSEGSDDWLDYFRVVGAAFAIVERCPVERSFVGMDAREIVRLGYEKGQALDVRRKLDAFAIAAQHISSGKSQGSYHLIVLNAAEKTVSISSFGTRRLEEANQAYANAEISASISEQDIQPVLVATDSIDKLRRAYPNYFLDTREFMRVLTRIENQYLGDIHSGQMSLPLGG